MSFLVCFVSLMHVVVLVLELACNLFVRVSVSWYSLVISVCACARCWEGVVVLLAIASLSMRFMSFCAMVCGRCAVSVLYQGSSSCVLLSVFQSIGICATMLYACFAGVVAMCGVACVRI